MWYVCMYTEIRKTAEYYGNYPSEKIRRKDKPKQKIETKICGRFRRCYLLSPLKSERQLTDEVFSDMPAWVGYACLS